MRGCTLNPVPNHFRCQRNSWKIGDHEHGPKYWTEFANGLKCGTNAQHDLSNFAVRNSLQESEFVSVPLQDSSLYSFILRVDIQGSLKLDGTNETAQAAFLGSLDQQA